MSQALASDTMVLNYSFFDKLKGVIRKINGGCGKRWKNSGISYFFSHFH